MASATQQDGRIRQRVTLRVVGWPQDTPQGAGCVPGELVEWEDGRWALWLSGARVAHGDRHDGARALAVALLGLANRSGR